MQNQSSDKQLPANIPFGRRRQLPKGTYIEITEDGIPISRYADPCTKTYFMQLVQAVSSIEYIKPEFRDEDRFEGMTAIEVAVCKQAERMADGDLDSLEVFLDRMLGKPKQETQNVTVNVNYSDYLDGLIREDMEESELAEVSVMVSRPDLKDITSETPIRVPQPHKWDKLKDL